MYQVDTTPASYRRIREIYSPPFGKVGLFIGGESELELINLDNGQILATHVREAQTFWKRLKGLMFTKHLPTGCALHIQPCQSIHTFLMNYSIDVLHLDRDHRVVATEQNVTPRSIGKKVRETVSVVELPAGTIQQTDTQVGQAVQFQN